MKDLQSSEGSNLKDEVDHNTIPSARLMSFNRTCTDRGQFFDL
jgi:hypothetical protein